MKRNYSKVAIMLILSLISWGSGFSQSSGKIAKTIDKMFGMAEKYYASADSIYNTLNSEIKNSAHNPIENAIWNSIMADFLNTWKDDRHYEISKRTEIDGETPTDFKEWNLKTFEKVIENHYRSSIKDFDILSTVPAKDFKEVFFKESTKELKNLNLFDIIGRRVINFEKNKREQNKNFITELYRTMIEYHAGKSEYEEVAFLSVEKYEYEKEFVWTNETEDDYIDTLIKLRNSLPENTRDFVTLPENSRDYITLKLAERYAERANKYDENHPEYKDDFIRACELYNEIVKNPKSEYYKDAADNIKKIKETSADISGFINAAGVGETLMMELSHRNLTKAYIKVVKIPENLVRFILQGGHIEKYWQTLSQQKPVYKNQLQLTDNKDFRFEYTPVLIPGLKNGAYIIFVSENDNPANFDAYSSWYIFQVSDIFVEKRSDENGLLSFLTVNRKTGEPLKNAAVNFISSTKSEKHSFTSDNNGIVKTNIDGHRYVRINNIAVQWNGQTLYCNDFRFDEYMGQTSQRESYKIFTDRKLYRPGQKVFFKVIATEEIIESGNTKELKLLVDKSVNVVLYDVNYQKIDGMTLKTNEFGSVSGEFELPLSGLTGSFSLRVNDKESYFFNVEEYKRPTFDVQIKELENAYKIGQPVEVEGIAEAFAGYPISGAKVSYSVTRAVEYPWRRWFYIPSEPDKTIMQGEVETDDEGRFRIEFVADGNTSRKSHNPLFVFKINAVVTDINGETHSANSYVRVSKRTVLVDFGLPEDIEKNSTDNKFEISLTNLYGKPQSGKIEYEIYQLSMPERFYHNSPLNNFKNIDKSVQTAFPFYAFNGENDKSRWNSVKVFEGSKDVVKDAKAYLEIPDIQKLTSGYYKIKVKTSDPSGDWIEEEKTTHIYSKTDKKCTGYEEIWTNIPSEVKPGENLEFEFGTYYSDANILCEVVFNDKIIRSEWHHLHKDKISVSLPTGIRDEGVLGVFIYLINNGIRKTFYRNVYINNEEKDIRFDFLRFRDKTQPGGKEEYQVRLIDKDSKPVSAELLASMYDFSLESLGGLNIYYLNYPVNHRYFSPVYNMCQTFGYRFSSHYHNIYLKHYSYKVPYFNIPFIYSTLYCEMDEFSVAETKIRSKNAVSKDLDFYEDVVCSVAEEAVFESAAGELKEVGFKYEGAPNAETGQPVVRTNFNETAFFYPELRTDAKGDVFISFTIPEALTEWRLQGAAHSKTLQTGVFSKLVQTVKDVMVVPNTPRFLREGDTMYFSAKVVNMSDRNICGYVSLEFFNTETGKPTAMISNGLTTATEQYDIAAGASQQVKFRIAVQEDISAVTYRIIAHNTDPAGIAGDGEEKILPILPNRMLVTETMPFWISKKGVKAFTFNKLRNGFGSSLTLKNYRLTVDCTPNPVWYAIQAMPYMMEYPYDCNEQKFSRYYANALATHILKSNPAIEQIFNTLKEESSDAFCSALEKNQELKQLLLEETPWVLDAQREGANKQNMALLFDFKKMSKQENKIIGQLKKSQNSDGGWPWFDGGKSSSYITGHILAGFGHLKALGVETSAHNSFLNKSVDFIDREMHKRYLDRKKYNIDYVYENHYLYTRSFYKKSLSSEYQKAYNECYQAMIKNWKSESFYSQAMIALTAWRNGDKEVAKTIVSYLKSMAQHDEEMGMFWKRQGGGWFWYERPVERQAMLIEAFHTITPDDKVSIAGMQLWLLKQKQTQNWGTTKSTTEAVYALLLNNTNVSDNNSVTLHVGNQTLPDKDMTMEAGSGYFKKSWMKDEINADMASLKIEKSTDGPAWGEMYWQYYENLDKITRSDDKNLIVEKELYLVKNTDSGEVLRRITEGQPVKVGDKVRVRIVITTDRDMEYVHLKDQRAASFEPVNILSGYKHQDGLWYYESTRDASTNFFIEHLRKGKYVFEYTLFATQEGNFSNGITNIQCMYAPEFNSHSQGIRIEVK